jgi:hypothetical protein
MPSLAGRDFSGDSKKVTEIPGESEINGFVDIKTFLCRANLSGSTPSRRVGGSQSPLVLPRPVR